MANSYRVFNARELSIKKIKAVYQYLNYCLVSCAVHERLKFARLFVLFFVDELKFGKVSHYCVAFKIWQCVSVSWY